MRIIDKTPATDVADVLNPRGNLAQELKRTVERAIWLNEALTLWLMYNDGKPSRARRNPMTRDVPPGFIDAKRYNVAVKNSQIFDSHSFGWPKVFTTKGKYRGNQAQRTSAIPSEWRRTTWDQLFEYWISGGLMRGIEQLTDTLPEENQQQLQEVLNA